MVAGLRELLEKVSALCPIPATATRVMSVVDDPRSHIRNVAEAIAVDPALAAEAMRIANSPAFGTFGRIRDLEHAINILGLGEIRGMAAAMAMLAAFRTETELGPELHETSVLTGALARRVAKDLPGVSRCEAFLCGLLSEVGAMACLAIDGKGYMDLWTQCGGEPIARAKLEQDRYGGCSYEFGGGLLARNNLPRDVYEAVGIATTSDPRSWSTLGRLTVFARVTSPRLVCAVRQNAVHELPGILAQAAASSGVPLETDQLMQACFDAGIHAEHALRQAG